MYKKFYFLTRNPFELSPDPYFFYPTHGHNEALATLTYGILKKKGFAVVTGEVGTGKTLLLRCLLEFLAKHNVACAFVYNPLLSVQDFLTYLATDLRLSAPGRGKAEMLCRLNDYLLERERRGEATALIIDEAHLLSWELLEEVRLLTNLETSSHKLLQIALVGQPELDRKLDSPALRQLKQRIGLRCRLEPLNLEEVRGYVSRRLELSRIDGRLRELFSESAIAAVHEFSGGIPRVINNLCENSLLAGYGKQSPQITESIVRGVASDLRLPSSFLPQTQNSEAGDAADEQPAATPMQADRQIELRIAQRGFETT